MTIAEQLVHDYEELCFELIVAALDLCTSRDYSRLENWSVYLFEDGSELLIDGDELITRGGRICYDDSGTTSYRLH